MHEFRTQPISNTFCIDFTDFIRFISGYETEKVVQLGIIFVQFVVDVTGK